MVLINLNDRPDLVNDIHGWHGRDLIIYHFGHVLKNLYTNVIKSLTINSIRYACIFYTMPLKLLCQVLLFKKSLCHIFAYNIADDCL